MLEIAQVYINNPTFILDTIEIRHLIEADKIKWNEYLGPFARLGRKFTFIVSDYQTVMDVDSFKKLLEIQDSKLEILQDDKN